MKRHKLFAVIALSLGAAVTAHAADYDDRYYFAPWLGASFADNDRDTKDHSLLYGLGIGKYVAPNTAIDLFVDRTSRVRNPPFTSNWVNEMVGLSVRYYFLDPESWQPYLMAGAGMIHHAANPNAFGNNVADKQKGMGWDPGIQLGVGLARNYNENIRFRGEIAYRYDMDDNSLPSTKNYGDWNVSLGLTIAFGAHEKVAVTQEERRETKQTTPPKAPPDCHSLDDDKDGVNNCDDKCPGTPAGTIVGPDGCPQKVTIDLRGVNFRFDYPKPGVSDINQGGLVDGSIAILDQAVDVLKRYPNVQVDVAGHTDSIGTDEYNQGLSERRAKIVYDYLTSHGVSPSRLQGPHGFGESKPIDTNKTKEGRARNRRTELNVQ